MIVYKTACDIKAPKKVEAKKVHGKKFFSYYNKKQSLKGSLLGENFL